MKVLLSLAIVIMLAGCTQQPVKQQEAASSHADIAEDRLDDARPGENPRVEYLRNTAQLVGENPEYLYAVDSLFSLMKDIQDGRLTTSDLSGALFYFEDTLGHDTGYMYDSTYFKCIQVMDMGEHENAAGEKFPAYMALYFNNQIEMTVTVIWAGTRPLLGQKLNVDFLTYVGVDTYRNKNNEDMTQVIFARPYWAGSNGYTPD